MARIRRSSGLLILGSRNLNLAFQKAVNPTGPAVERYGWTFRVGDKVMQTVNDYDKDAGAFAAVGQVLGKERADVQPA